MPGQLSRKELVLGWKKVMLQKIWSKIRKYSRTLCSLFTSRTALRTNNALGQLAGLTEWRRRCLGEFFYCQCTWKKAIWCENIDRPIEMSGFNHLTRFSPLPGRFVWYSGHQRRIIWSTLIRMKVTLADICWLAALLILFVAGSHLTSVSAESDLLQLFSQSVSDLLSVTACDGKSAA